MVFDLRKGDTSVSIDAERGGRLTSLRIHDREILVTPNANDSALYGGCYPMAPYAGRVRSGIVNFNNIEHPLPLTLPPHAAHGTVFNQSWEVADITTSSVVLLTDLGPHWPFGGAVTHHVEVHDDHVHMKLSLTASNQHMPAQVGWHPWFCKPSRTSFKFASMLKRDETGIATSHLVKNDANNVDDCFIQPSETLSLTVNEVELSLTSNCTHWVVYDLPIDSTCVAPQSGAPNQINDSPFILGPYESLTKWFDISWTGRLNHQ